MCPSPAAVRRYPNVTLMAPAAAATPSLLRPLRPCSNNTTGNFDDKKHYPRLEGQPQISILLPCPTRVLYTGGRILAWTHRSTKEESIRINQFLRRTAAIVSRGGKLTTTERMAERRGEHTRQGTARHGTARHGAQHHLLGSADICLGGFLFGPCMRPLGTEPSLATRRVSDAGKMEER